MSTYSYSLIGYALQRATGQKMLENMLEMQQFFLKIIFRRRDDFNPTESSRTQHINILKQENILSANSEECSWSKNENNENNRKGIESSRFCFFSSTNIRKSPIDGWLPFPKKIQGYPLHVNKFLETDQLQKPKVQRVIIPGQGVILLNIL